MSGEADPLERMREISARLVDPEIWADMHQQIVNLLPDGLLVVDAAGHIKLVNSQLELMFGYNRLTLIGQHFEMLLPDDLRERHGTLFASYFAAPTVRPMHGARTLLGRASDGRPVATQISLGPLVSQRGIWVLALLRRVADGTS